MPVPEEPIPTPPPKPTSGNEELDRDAEIEVEEYEGGEGIDNPEESRSRETVRRLGWRVRLFRLDDLVRVISEDEEACIVLKEDMLVVAVLWPA